VFEHLEGALWLFVLLKFLALFRFCFISDLHVMVICKVYIFEDVHSEIFSQAMFFLGGLILCPNLHTR
jgi:hypothetical protein